MDGVFSRTFQEGKGKSSVPVGFKKLTVKKVQDEGDGVLAVAAAEATALWGSSIKMVEECSQDLTTGKSARLIVF